MLPFTNPMLSANSAFPIVQDFVQPTSNTLLTQTVTKPVGAASLTIEAYGYGGEGDLVYDAGYAQNFYFGGQGGQYARWAGTAQNVVIYVPGRGYNTGTYLSSTAATTTGGTVLAQAWSGASSGTPVGTFTRVGGEGASRLETDFDPAYPTRICGGGGAGGPTANGGVGQPWNETNTTVIGSGGAGGGGLAGAGGTSSASLNGQNYGGGAAVFYDWALPGPRAGIPGLAILRLTWS